MGLLAPRTVAFVCDVDLERTDDSFHAYVIPDGIDMRPGDTVLVQGLPDRLQYGERRQFRAQATVRRAGWFRRLWTEAVSIFELTSLYEVGFQPHDELVLRQRTLSA